MIIHILICTYKLLFLLSVNKQQCLDMTWFVDAIKNAFFVLNFQQTTLLAPERLSEKFRKVILFTLPLLEKKVNDHELRIFKSDGPRGREKSLHTFMYLSFRFNKGIFGILIPIVDTDIFFVFHIQIELNDT